MEELVLDVGAITSAVVNIDMVDSIQVNDMEGHMDRMPGATCTAVGVPQLYSDTEFTQTGLHEKKTVPHLS